MRHLLKLAAFSVILVTFAGVLMSAEHQEKPFGGKMDIDFAKSVWEAIEDYDEWPMRSDFYPGQSPHGAVLRLYYSVVNVEGKPYHTIIKDNYDGTGADVDSVSQSPDEYLASVTIMVQREEGYDPDNQNWFWAKYLKDGSLDKNAKGVALAGRVAKGMTAGCISCHTQADDDDYLFMNDD